MPLLMVLLLLFATGAEAAAPRPAHRGTHVAVLGCITASIHVAAQRGCRTVPGAGHESSQDSGLNGVISMALAAGGTSLYAVGNMNSAITQLTIEPSREISFGGCLTGNSFLDNCLNVPGASANAVESPISSPTAAAISPDGRFLYLVSGSFHDSVVAQFSRDPISGAIAYQSCLTGSQGAGPSGSGACSTVPTATRDGYGSGLNEPSGITISADGAHVYVTAGLDESVFVFSRNPSDGSLSPQGCVSSNPRAAGCVRIPGGNHVLEGIGSPLISPDGRYLYGAANRAASVAAFAITGSGGVTFASCVSGDDDRRPCRRGRHPNGPIAALSNPATEAGSADGKFIYVSSTYGTVVVLKRNRASGALTATSCISGNIDDRGRCTLVPHAKDLSKDSPLAGIRTPLIRRNGKIVFAPVRVGDGIVEFRRNAKSGALSFRGCVSGSLQHTGGNGICSAFPKATRKGVDSGFYKTTFLVQGPGNLIYAAASGDSTVSVLRP